MMLDIEWDWAIVMFLGFGLFMLIWSWSVI